MKFDELSTEQKAVLQNTDLLCRKALLSARVTLTLMQAADTEYSAISKAIMDTLDTGEVIPKATSLDGAVSLPHEAHVELLAAFKSLLAAWTSAETNAKHAKFVGAVNLAGR